MPCSGFKCNETECIYSLCHRKNPSALHGGVLVDLGNYCSRLVSAHFRRRSLFVELYDFCRNLRKRIVSWRRIASGEAWGIYPQNEPGSEAFRVPALLTYPTIWLAEPKHNNPNIIFSKIQKSWSCSRTSQDRKIKLQLNSPAWEKQPSKRA